MIGSNNMENNNKDLKSFYSYLREEEYLFNKEIIENYLLSLKVKPFLIFTGNSGTGKTKLSQLFAKFLEEYPYVPEYWHVETKSNFSSWSNTSWTLSSKDFEDIFPINECQIDFKMSVDGFPTEGNISPSIQLKYDSDELKKYFENKFNENPNQNIKLMIDTDSLIDFISDDYIEVDGGINLVQKSNKSAHADRQWMVSKSFYDYVPFKYGYFPCNIIVDGIESKASIRILFKLTYKKNASLQKYLKMNSGKDVKVKIEFEGFNFGEYNSKLIPNVSDENSKKYEIIPIGSNWTDNTNIVGYHNVITNKYQSTTAYELIKKAQKDLNDPYFLILDEMNLSHVERYFADFLSAIESGEKIPLQGNEPLCLPNNLFIEGTVNVDETTYMFSPKVLDRANTIEFETLRASDYMSQKADYNDFNGNIKYLQYPLIDSDVSNLGIKDLKEKFSDIVCNDGNLWDVLSRELTMFQDALRGSGFDFGFRVINEILRVMLVAWEYENSPTEWIGWERYFDAQIKQKILPKLHGSEKAIGNVLNDLFNLCLENRGNNENPKNFSIDKNQCRYLTSALKLQNMVKVLSDQRYVSFIN